jgi:GDP-4-dehydro-6-deoxy-D-mannose reductase
VKKYLITGFSGFVSRHFLDYLENNKIQAVVLGLDLAKPLELPSYQFVKWSFLKTNLAIYSEVEKAILDYKPDYILHLASFSSVHQSWKDPMACFNNNTVIYLNLLEVLRLNKIKARVLSIGSSEEYGTVTDAELPLTEDSKINPLNPYALAKYSQELIGKLYAQSFLMDIVMTRSFNHLGPGKKENFVIASFAKQLTELAEKGIKEGELITGDINVIRDFLDVRDVVEAYYLLLESGKIGNVYNVCRGESVTLREIINILADKLGLKINIIIDPGLIRPTENKKIIGSNEKIRMDVNWKPKIPLEKSLEDIIEHWKNKIFAG